MWSDLPQRIATIGIGIPILLLIWSHDVTRWIFFLGLHGALVVEYVRLTRIPTHWGVYFGIVAFILLQTSNGEIFALTWVGSTALLALLQARRTTAEPTGNGSISTMEAIITGWIWIVIPCRSLLYISDKGFQSVVTLLLTAWNADTGALVVGRSLASTPLHWLRHISPNKTLPGLVGALIGGTLTYNYLMSAIWQWSGEPPVSSRWIDGIILSSLGILGDLFESSLKRKYNQKDSSRLLPGHGGVLDRFDSVMMAALYYHILLLQDDDIGARIST